MTMLLPEWTPELEDELRRAYQTAPAEPAAGGSRHTGLKAVYELLESKTRELEAQRQAEALREAQRQEYLTNIPTGPWDDAADWERSLRRNDAPRDIPDAPFL